MINHYVPEGKVLTLPTGGYRFVGPVRVKLGGPLVKLPATYEDGSPTNEGPKDGLQSIGQFEQVGDVEVSTVGPVDEGLQVQVPLDGGGEGFEEFHPDLFRDGGDE